MLRPKYVASATFYGRGGTIAAVKSSDHQVQVKLARFFVGARGPAGTAGDALQVSNRLSELAVSQAVQEEAQANLGLGVADPVAYYILAKA